jgi:hypothetical protein
MQYCTEGSKREEENLNREDHLEALCLDGRITLQWILEKGWEHVDRIHLAQGRSQWWAVVNTIMNLHFP